MVALLIYLRRNKIIFDITLINENMNFYTYLQEQDTPFRTMIEVMVKHFIEEKRGRASSRQNTVSEDRNERTKQRSIPKDARRDNVPKSSLELDQQLDLALRISNDNVSTYKPQSDLKTDRSKDSSPLKSSTVLRPAKSLSDIGSSNDFPTASERHNRGSLKPLSGGNNATGKARNQGAIQKTTEKSRKTKSKKTLSVNTNGLLFNNIDDSASHTSKGPQVEDGMLQISPQVSPSRISQNAGLVLLLANYVCLPIKKNLKLVLYV